MKAFLAIARREIHERRLVLAAAAAASAIPMAIPLLRGFRGSMAVDARSGTAMLVSFAFAFGLAAGLGVSILAPSIANRRVGFDFARPVSGLAIWGGRVAACCLLAVVSASIVWIPSLIAGAHLRIGDLFIDTELPRVWPLLLLALILAVFAACHAASVALRSGSALLAVDAGLALVVGLGFWVAFSRLPAFLAPEPRMRAAWGFALVAGLGLLLAGLASVARGRTDIRAAHRSLSLVFWSVAVAAVVGVTIYSNWVRAATPEDLGRQGFRVTPASSGTWVKVEGIARGARASFLYDTATGRFERVLVTDWYGPAISREGRRAAWVEARTGGGPFEILALNLDQPQARARRTRLFLEGYPSIFLLSADGERLATVERGVLSIHDLTSGRTLVSARIAEDRDEIRGLFVDKDRFRVFCQRAPGGGKTRVEILELDAASRRLRQRGELEAEGDLFLTTNRVGDRVIAVRYRDRQARLLDGATGTLLATLVEGGSDTSLWPGFLSDGRIVISESSSQGPRLSIFGRGGARERVIALPTGRFISLGGEVASGQIVVAVRDVARSSIYLVGIDDGRVRKLSDDLYPAALLRGDPSELNASPSPGSEATKLFLRSRELIRLDPVTGARRVVLGGVRR